jgi:hypothetical protein
MTMTLFQVLLDVSTFSPLVILAVYLYGRNYQSVVINILASISLLSLCSDLVGKYEISIGKGNLHVLDIYFPANLIAAIILYYNIYLQRKRVLQILCSLFLPSAAFFYVMVWREGNGGQSVNWTICAILIELMAIGHFYTLSKKPVENIKSFPPYWISLGFFSYCSISVIIFSLDQYMAKNFQLDLNYYVWGLHNLMNIAKNICFVVAIWFAADVRDRNENTISKTVNSLNQLL